MRLALFDLDNTLVQRDRAFALWAEEFSAAHRLDEEWTTWLILADAHHSGPMGPLFDTVRETLNLRQSSAELWRQYRQRMPQLVSCRPEDLAALASLRDGGWRLGIVTNGMTDNQLGKIRNSGLEQHVDGWCISEDVGIRKPEPEIFRLAARRCGVTTAGGWMVGDSLPLDVAGGAAAGLRTIWVAEPGLARIAAARGSDFFVGTAPDVVVTSVAQAAAVLLGTAP